MKSLFTPKLTPTLHIAHRGGGLLYPENTMLAFNAAVTVHRTDMIETDVHLTADGEVVIFHDATVDRCTDGSGPIAEWDWKTLSEMNAGYRFTTDEGKTHPFRDSGCRIPRLVELLRAYPELPLNIDIKQIDPEAVDAFAELIKHEKAQNRLCCGSEDDKMAAHAHTVLPDALHFFPRQALTAFVTAVMTQSGPPEDDRFTVLDMPLEYQGMRLVTPALIEVARAANKWINVWTIDEADVMRELLELGVGGIMTDRPDRLREVLG